MVWKITPLFAQWIASSQNILHRHGALHPAATVLELGCGISGIIGLALGSHIQSYVLTDQDYVMKLLNQNLVENRQSSVSSSNSSRRKNIAKPKRGSAPANVAQNASNITASVLDWEVDQVTASLTSIEGKDSFDVVIACDCIYNDALIEPLVQTCRDACSLRRIESGETSIPTLCVVAQQLRSPDVFEGWLKEFFKSFKVWRVPDNELIDGMKSDTGFVVHIGVLR